MELKIKGRLDRKAAFKKNNAKQLTNNQFANFICFG
jgi:hypothetical protein